MNAKRTWLLLATLAVLGATLPSPLGAQKPAEKPATRAEVEDLLTYARAAMEQGDLVQAEALLMRAEEAGIRYPLVHLGDTPGKVRRDFDKLKKDAPAPNPFLSKQAVASAAAPATGAPRALPAPAPGEVKPLAAAPAPSAYPTTGPAGAGSPKATATKLIADARAAMKRGDLAQAETLAAEASKLDVPDSLFAPGEDRPNTLAWDVQRARYQQQAGGVVTAAGEMAPGAKPAIGAQALYNPGADGSKNVPATYVGAPRVAQLPGAAQIPEPLPLGVAPSLPAPAGNPSELMQQGEAALVAGDRARALELFQAAAGSSADLSPPDQQRLRDHLALLGGTPNPLSTPAAGSMIEAATSEQQVLARQLSTDLGKRMVESRTTRDKEPRAALKMLNESRAEIEASKLTPELKEQLLRRADSAILEMERYVEDNRAQIELDEKNAAVLEDLERSRAVRVKVQEETAKLVDQFNTLLNEHRYEEAEVIAGRLYEMAPNEPIALQVLNQARFIRREVLHNEQRLARDEANWRVMNETDQAAIANTFDGEEMVFDPTKWRDLQARRGLSDIEGRMSPQELKIQQQLKTPVQLKYEDRPLAEVIEALSDMTGINIHLDPRGMEQEGVSTDTPVSINLRNEISLKSALDLILEPLHLGYTIKSDVLKITSEGMVKGEVITRVYYVADLVVPIPNFVPNNNFGLQGLINDAHAALGYGNGLGAPGPMVLANGDRNRKPGADGTIPEATLAQAVSGLGGGAPSTVPFGSGPGGAGGAANADFDSLIDLIISTVASDTWQENGGGVAEIRPFPTNLSLVISQTQQVHEEIVDLLEQLRKLQDLQVTIEVRFIRLNDNFFERIGIDFDLNINDRTIGTEDLTPGFNFETPRRTATVGIDQPTGIDDFPRYTADLDLPFRQGSFEASVPQFGGPVTGGASFGFAILSDIEAYFLINAAQGDRRTNVLNAPKVTLFNGQQAIVSDTSQSPFVISVIPVVGEFAAAQQPVIVVLSEGTLMSIQAVVSDDRRYVRLTVVPFFSEIGDVQEFTFEGSTTTTTSSSTTDDDEDGDNNQEDRANNQIRSGTTVQLPTFQFISVTTTVSVPDGGTVLLGGIKRLSEGRNEFGVPLLSKVPYINRLFRNTGIGRETDSLMMMVTPRIIIQEEEEAKLGIDVE